MAESQIPIAAVQLDLIPFNAKKNMEKAAHFAVQAAESGARLVVFPEFLNVGFKCTTEIFKHAETLDGHTVRAAKALSETHNIYLAFTMAERDGQDVYNAAIIVGPNGFFEKRRKAKPPFSEAFFYKGYDDDHVIQTPLGAIGIAVCADTFRYETYTSIAGLADFVLIMTSAPVSRLFGKRFTSTEEFTRIAHLYSASLRTPVIVADRTGKGSIDIPFFPYPSLESGFTEATLILDPRSDSEYAVGRGEGMVAAKVNVVEPRPKPKLLENQNGFVMDKGFLFSFLYKHLTAFGSRQYEKRRRRT
jgi:predicted amidohydrolase